MNDIETQSTTAHPETNLRIFEAFAGIGAQSVALKRLGAAYEVVGISEWMVDAIICYDAIHHAASIPVRRIESAAMISVRAQQPVFAGTPTELNRTFVRCVDTGAALFQLLENGLGLFVPS